MRFKNFWAFVNGVIGAAFVTGGATLLGIADNLSHHRPVNHAIEAPLVSGGIFAVLIGLGFVLAALVEMS